MNSTILAAGMGVKVSFTCSSVLSPQVVGLIGNTTFVARVFIKLDARTRGE